MKLNDIVWFDTEYSTVRQMSQRLKPLPDAPDRFHPDRRYVVVDLKRDADHHHRFTVRTLNLNGGREANNNIGFGTLVELACFLHFMEAVTYETM